MKTSKIKLSDIPKSGPGVCTVQLPARKIVYSDRYSALGIAPSNCDGPCEGTGYVPVKRTEKNRVLKKLWLEAERKKPSDDGWHFVICPDCKGKRK